MVLFARASSQAAHVAITHEAINPTTTSTASRKPLNPQALNPETLIPSQALIIPPNPTEKSPQEPENPERIPALLRLYSIVLDSRRCCGTIRKSLLPSRPCGDNPRSDKSHHHLYSLP